MKNKETLYDNIKLIKLEYGCALHVKHNGKWNPIFMEVVKEVYDPEKEPKEPKLKWWEFWK